MPSALESAGFLPYFGAAGGPRLYTVPGRAQLEAERMMQQQLQSALMQAAEDRRLEEAGNDPIVQSMLDYLTTGGMQPTPTPAPNPSGTASDIAEMTGILGPAVGLQAPAPSRSTPQPFSSLDGPFPAATGPISPGVNVEVGPAVIESRNGRPVSKTPTPEFFDTARQIQASNQAPNYGVNLPQKAGGKTSGRPSMTPQALKSMQSILPHYTQLRMANDAATGRQETAKLQGQFAMERKQVDAAVSVLAILQKREGALLEHDAKMAKIAGSGKVKKNDIKAIQAALNAAQKDANDTRRLLSDQNIAGLSESEPGSNARRYYDQIAELAQQKEQRVQMYQRILDQATMEQSPNTVKSSVGTPLSTTLSAEDQEAVTWARQNPKDPRAARILQSLGLAR